VDTPDDAVIRYQVEVRKEHYDCKILSCNGGNGASYNYTVKAVAGPGGNGASYVTTTPSRL